MYGFSLIFYEEITDIAIIGAITSVQKINNPLVDNISSNQSLETLEEPSSNSKSLPRHFKVSKNSLNDKARETKNPMKFDTKRDLLLVSKCICLIGQYPHVESARNFLTNFYRYYLLFNELKTSILLFKKKFRFAVHSNEISGEQSTDHPLSSSFSPESYIHYLLFSIPLPTPNQCIVIPNVPTWKRKHSLSNFLIIQRPSSFTELPLFEYDIAQVIDLLGIDGLIQLWTCLLLESQVLLHSEG